MNTLITSCLPVRLLSLPTAAGVEFRSSFGVGGSPLAFLPRRSVAKAGHDSRLTLVFRRSFFFLFALACFALVQNAQALLPAPSPDGGYPGGNTAEGVNALHDVNTAVGKNNTAVGFNALTHNITGSYNVAVGSGALATNTTGNFNMAIGTEALTNNNANFNLAIGFRVGYLNTTGRHLTGIGAAALRNNTTGSFNTAIGSEAMRANTVGEENTAIGADALSNNTTGHQNTANGAFALFSNTEGISNTAVGYQALYFNTIGGDFNTAMGDFALFSNTSGANNTAIGRGALLSLRTGESNTAIGNFAGSELSGAESGNIYIGSGAYGVAGDDHVIRIGNVFSGYNSCFIRGISGMNVPGGQQVYVDASGHLGTSQASSARYKEDIKPMDKASESILALKPITFRYKKEFEPRGTPQFGLLAEEVAKVNPDLVGLDHDGKPISVRYEAVNAMLLNEFLKEHRKVENLRNDFQATVAQQQKEIEALTAMVKEQAAQIHKVDAQLEVGTGPLTFFLGKTAKGSFAKNN